MAKIKKENKNKAEKHIKGSNKNILGKKTSKPRKVSLTGREAKLTKNKPKTETADRYKKKSTGESSKRTSFKSKEGLDKGRSKKKDDFFGKDKWKKEGGKPAAKKFSTGAPKRERSNTPPDDKGERKSSYKDFRAKGDKIKKDVPSDRRTFLSTDQKRKLSQKEIPETSRPKKSFETDKRSAGDFPKEKRKSESPKTDDFTQKKSAKKDYSEQKSEKSSAIALPVAKPASKEVKEDDGKIRLNRFISNAGVCSRRDADNMIKEGLIKVNGEVITELGYKVNPEDSIKYGNKVLRREKFVYILLNKPKDFITTLDDPEERKTVMDLVKNACTERVYPVGRLDRNTTGLLLLTNDGSLTATLSHPSYEVKKIYQVDLDKPITPEDFDKIVQGVELEDGLVNVDDIEIVSEDRKMIGIEIHVGRNRIVRRLFEHLGYDVVQLDRVMYAGLTKKDLSRGKWRMLTTKEVISLKHFKKGK